MAVPGLNNDAITRLERSPLGTRIENLMVVANMLSREAEISQDPGEGPSSEEQRVMTLENGVQLRVVRDTERETKEGKIAMEVEIKMPEGGELIISEGAMRQWVAGETITGLMRHLRKLGVPDLRFSQITVTNSGGDNDNEYVTGTGKQWYPNVIDGELQAGDQEVKTSSNEQEALKSLLVRTVEHVLNQEIQARKTLPEIAAEKFEAAGKVLAEVKRTLGEEVHYRRRSLEQAKSDAVDGVNDVLGDAVDVLRHTVLPRIKEIASRVRSRVFGEEREGKE